MRCDVIPIEPQQKVVLTVKEQKDAPGCHIFEMEKGYDFFTGDPMYLETLPNPGYS